MPSETSVERRFVACVQAQGGWSFKLVPLGVSGLPDRLAVLPGGRVWFVELKQTRGRLRRGQTWVLAKLRRLGCNVAVLWTREQVDEWHQLVQNSNPPTEEYQQ